MIDPSEFRTYYRAGNKIVEVDTKKAKYQGKPWTSLSEFQKRKYENLIVLTNNTRQKINFIYKC